MNLSEVFQAANAGGPLLSRFTAAVWKAATDVKGEAPGTPSHTKRMNWAKRALLQDGKAQAYAATMLRMAMSENAGMRAAWSQADNGEQIPDADIQAVVSAYVDTFAGSDL